MVQQEGKPGSNRKFPEQTEWSIERMNNKKIEDTEECRRWRNLTQTETNSQLKELCTEIEEVLETYGVEHGKRGVKKRQRRGTTVVV